MRKKGLLLVVALLALSGLMAAMAFTNARVEGKMSLKVVNTNEALLALTLGNHMAAYLADTEPGIKGTVASVLKINLNKGKGGAEYGLQRDSKYEGHDLFKVTNNSENKVSVTVSVDREKGEPYIYLKTGSSWSNGSKITFTLEPGESKWIDIQVHTPYELRIPPKSFSWEMVVSAVAVP